MKFEIEYNTIESVAGPLVVVGKVRNAAYNEIVRIKLQNGEERLGQVLETTDTHAVVQVFGPTNGINIDTTSVSFLGETFKMGVSERHAGKGIRRAGKAKDIKTQRSHTREEGHKRRADKPCSRAMPSDFIETGISAIDGLEHTCKGAEASYILSIRASAQRACSADNKAGKGKGSNRELRSGVRRNRNNIRRRLISS